MGSTPTEKYEIDLDGTGVLVDVTSHVSRTDRVEFRWGRTDWASPQPQPGSLRFSLENLDGRFTPGNTATYDVGCVVGVLVQWTVGTRVRRFTIAAAELSFPTGVKGMSVVTVNAYDALQDLARRTLSTMLDEAVMARTPYLYWPLDESAGAGVSQSQVEAQDHAGAHRLTSGYTLRPASWNTIVGPALDPAFEWGKGVGPETDGRPALTMWPGATTPPDPRDAFLWTGPMRGHFPTFTNALPAGSGLTLHSNLYAIGLSMWVNPSATAGYAAFSSGADSSTDYVVLADLGSFKVLWRPRADSLTIVSRVSGAWTATHFFNQEIKRSQTTHLSIAMFTGGSGSYSKAWYVWVNGESPHSSGVTSSGTDTVGPSSVFIGGSYTTSWVAASSIYGFVGTISNISIHTSPGISRSTTGPWWEPNEQDLFMNGVHYRDSSTNSFGRIGRMLNRDDITFGVEGAPAIYTTGSQDTAGQSLLAAACDTLRGEGALLDVSVVSGTSRVRAWMDGSNSATASPVVIDVQDDANAVPEMAFDTSGVAATVTVSNRAENLEVTWSDPDVPVQWAGTSDSITSALAEERDALTVAQQRALLGRVTRVAPTVVKVNAVASKATITSALLALRPAARVLIVGLPAGVVGYERVQAEVIGATERYGLGLAEFELRLAPVTLPDGWTDPEVGTEGAWRLTAAYGLDAEDQDSDNLARPYNLRGYNGTLVSDPSAFGAADTTLSLATEYPTMAGAIGFTTDPDDYPLYLELGTGEIICVPAPPTSLIPSPLLATRYFQRATGVLRGQLGTTAQAGSATRIYRVVNTATASGLPENTYTTF